MPSGRGRIRDGKPEAEKKCADGAHAADRGCGDGGLDAEYGYPKVKARNKRNIHYNLFLELLAELRFP